MAEASHTKNEFLENLLTQLKGVIESFREKDYSSKIILGHTVKYNIATDFTTAKVDKSYSKVYFFEKYEEEATLIFEQFFLNLNMDMGTDISLSEEIYNNMKKKKCIFASNYDPKEDKDKEDKDKEDKDKDDKNNDDWKYYVWNHYNGNSITPKSLLPEEKMEETQMEKFRRLAEKYKDKLEKDGIPKLEKCESDNDDETNLKRILYKILYNQKKLYFYYFQMPTYEATKDLEVCDGAFVLICREELTDEEILKIQTSFTKWTAAVSTDTFTNKIRQESIKSAIAAIMSRNMSHNLGSHVITNTRYQIEKLSVNSKDTKVQKQLNGVAALLEYLQERQDFVAVIANEDQYAKGPLNFKTAVFDTLAMDGPAKRHTQDGSGNLDRQVHNYILDNIVRSEEIYRNDDILEIPKGRYPIEIQMVKVDGNGTLIKDTDNKNLIFKSNPQVVNNNPDSSHFTDIQLAVPYGLNGRQAFLIIIENIIRNAAKHNKEDLKSDLTFSIIIKETNKNYEITIADNKQNYNTVIAKFKENGNEPDKDKSILDKAGKLKKLNILSKYAEGRIDRNNKGIKEILIALSWLKSEVGNMEYHKIEDEDDYNHNLLKLVGVGEDFKIYPDTSNKSNLSLGYQFTIDKYLEFYEVTDDEIQTLQNSKNFSIELAKLTSAFIYVFPTTINSDILKKVKKHLTRVIVADLRNLIYKDKYNKIILLYENLIKNKLYNDKELPILIAENKINTKFDDFNSKLVVRKGDAEKVADKHNGKDYILYINHYENRLFKEKITEEEKATCKIAKFVDGISGGNYTHNLINSKIDKLRYLKIIETALTKIAIVDERIFHRFNGVTVNEEHLLNKIKEFKKWADKNKPFMFEFILQKLISLNNINYDEIIEAEIINNFENDIELAKIFETKLIQNYNENIYYDYLIKKNIFIFNSKDDGTLIDLKGNLLSENDNNFDFVSIHLGLIDKINGQKERHVKDIIEDFKIRFSKSKLLIHSGRGGLIDADNVSFIPFSGIDWAIDNCKYVFAELFYGQVYK